MPILLDCVTDGFGDEGATSIGQTVLIERFGMPYPGTIDGDAGEGVTGLDIDWLPRINRRHRSRKSDPTPPT